MQLEKEELYRLTEGWLKGTLTDEETIILNNWYQQYGNEIDVFIEGDTEEAMRLRMLTRLKQHTKAAPVKRIWLKYAAAVIIICCIGAYFYTAQKHKPVPLENSITHDVPAPGTNRATLTLANGQKIILDSVAVGSLANEGEVTVKKLNDGQIVYSGHSNAIVYNTLTNPRGSKAINITLSDGSRVWLNSESSIIYPAAFVANKREVEIIGEAYFEIAQDSKRPFIVKANKTEVAVLGTHFNINTYTDIIDTRVTLLEGSVRVTKDNFSRILKPGEQAKVNESVDVINSADIEEVMAWKNGKFQFEGASIETIMNQVARWYNTEIIYEGKIEGNFVVSISRKLPVSKLLNLLSLTDRVKFEIKGNKIIVRPV